MGESRAFPSNDVEWIRSWLAWTDQHAGMLRNARPLVLTLAPEDASHADGGGRDGDDGGGGGDDGGGAKGGGGGGGGGVESDGDGGGGVDDGAFSSPGVTSRPARGRVDAMSARTLAADDGSHADGAIAAAAIATASFAPAAIASATRSTSAVAAATGAIPSATFPSPGVTSRPARGKVDAMSMLADGSVGPGALFFFNPTHRPVRVSVVFDASNGFRCTEAAFVVRRVGSSERTEPATIPGGGYRLAVVECGVRPTHSTRL